VHTHHPGVGNFMTATFPDAADVSEIIQSGSFGHQEHHQNELRPKQRRAAEDRIKELYADLHHFQGEDSSGGHLVTAHLSRDRKSFL
jgi:hypothetical protein